MWIDLESNQWNGKNFIELNKKFIIVTSYSHNDFSKIETKNYTMKLKKPEKEKENWKT